MTMTFPLVLTTLAATVLAAGCAQFASPPDVSLQVRPTPGDTGLAMSSSAVPQERRYYYDERGVRWDDRGKSDEATP
jgi:hypothetical protein